MKPIRIIVALVASATGALTGCAAHAPRPASVVSEVKLAPAHPEPELVVVRHTVEKGQTLYRIAKTYGVTVEELSAANGLSDPTSIAVGQELVIPGAGQALTVRPTAPGSATGAANPAVASSTVRPDAKAAGTPAGSRPAPMSRPTAEQARTRELAPGGKLSWPLRGVLYARFGKKGREAHDGIDLAAPEGTPVITAAPGRVLFAGEQRGYGLLAIVQHGDGLVTLYAHNRDLRVRTGQAVRAGQVIATVGQSGRTSGPHLHFEVRRDGLPVDPLAHLPSPSSMSHGRAASRSR